MVDDAIDFAKTYSAANPNTALFVLTPIPHGSVDAKAALTNKRLLEDKLYARFG